MAEPGAEAQPGIKVQELSSIEERADALGVKVPEGLGLLPANFFTAAEQKDLKYQSHTLDMKVLFKGAGLSVGMVEADRLKIPFVEDRDATWFGPIVLFGAAALSQNPNLVGVALNVLSSYIYDLFKGKEGKKNVRLSFLVEKTDKKRTVKVDFDGPPEDLPDVETVIKNIFK